MQLVSRYRQIPKVTFYESNPQLLQKKQNTSTMEEAKLPMEKSAFATQKPSQSLNGVPKPF